MDEPFLRVIQSKHERSKMCAAAFRLGVASDHTLHLMPDLDLQPFAASALLVAASPALCHDAFKALGFRHLKQGLALFFVMIGITHRISGLDDGCQLLLAVLQRHAAPVFSV